MRIKGLYIHNEAQDESEKKKWRKQLAWYWCFSCPTHTICLSSCVREERFANHLTVVEWRL